MTRITTWDLVPGQLVQRLACPGSSPVVVHDVREATFPTPGRDVAVWLLGGWAAGEVGKYRPFAVNAGSGEEWLLLTT